MSITSLTKDNFREIIHYLNLFEIRALSLTCKEIRKILRSEEISKFIASLPFGKKLYARVIPITQGRTFQRMVQAPKKLPQVLSAIQLATLEQCQVCDTIKSYKEGIAQDIQDWVDSQELLAPKEIQQLKAYMKARDTIIIWAVITKKVNLTLPFKLHSMFWKSSIWSQSKNVLDKANEYQQWCQNNSNSLSPVTELKLYQNSIQDLTSLTTLVNLEELELSRNSIQDLTPLANLLNLKRLNLSQNSIQDLTPLGTLLHLEGLELSRNVIEDLTPLNTLVNLTWVYLSENIIQDLTPLNTLLNLKRLYLSQNRIQNLTPLTTLVNLEGLELSRNSIHNPISLTTLVNLKRLYLSQNKIQDLRPLTTLINLTSLNLSQNHVQDLTPMTALVKLKELNLSQNNIEDLKPLQALEIEKLDISGNPCSSLKLSSSHIIKWIIPTALVLVTAISVAYYLGSSR